MGHRHFRVAAAPTLPLVDAELFRQAGSNRPSSRPAASGHVRSPLAWRCRGTNTTAMKARRPISIGRWLTPVQGGEAAGPLEGPPPASRRLARGETAILKRREPPRGTRTLGSPPKCRAAGRRLSCHPRCGPQPGREEPRPGHDGPMASARADPSDPGPARGSAPTLLARGGDGGPRQGLRPALARLQSRSSEGSIRPMRTLGGRESTSGGRRGGHVDQGDSP